MQQDLTLHQIRLFLKVAELGSISKAGSAMLVPQPAVSRLITRLESNLGSPLLERLGRGVCLTPAGERFKKRAELIVHHHDLARQDVQETQDQLYGEVRLATPESVGDILFVPLVRHFRQHHPGVAVRVVAAASASIPTLMDNGMVDIGVMADTHAPPSGHVEPLCREEFYLVGPKGSAKTAGETVKLDQIADLPLILNAMQGGFRTVIDRAFSSCNFHPNVQIEIDANDPLLDLILEGEGFSILPFSTIARKHQLSGLSAARIVSPDITRQLLLATAPGRPMTPLCREVARQVPAIMRSFAKVARWK